MIYSSILTNSYLLQIKADNFIFKPQKIIVFSYKKQSKKLIIKEKKVAFPRGFEPLGIPFTAHTIAKTKPVLPEAA